MLFDILVILLGTAITALCLAGALLVTSKAVAVVLVGFAIWMSKETTEYAFWAVRRSALEPKRPKG